MSSGNLSLMLMPGEQWIKWSVVNKMKKVVMFGFNYDNWGPRLYSKKSNPHTWACLVYIQGNLPGREAFPGIRFRTPEALIFFLLKGPEALIDAWVSTCLGGQEANRPKLQVSPFAWKRFSVFFSQANQ
jgi:hypothetical protein